MSTRIEVLTGAGYHTEIERSSTDDKVLHEENDIQFGLILFNEKAWALRFSCNFCQKIYSEIAYFYEHLSEHVNKSNEYDEIEGEEPPDEENAYIESATEVGSFGEQRANVAIIEAKEFVLDDVDALVEEELDDAEVIAAAVEEEVLGELENRQTHIENSSSAEFAGYDEEQKSTVLTQTKALNFQDYFIQQTQTATDGITLPEKKKKVTTVKIIASRNRVEDLYERIMAEKQKSATNTMFDILSKEKEALPIAIEGNNQFILDTNINECQIDCSTNLIEAETSTLPRPDVVRSQVIGETLITLLPESIATATAAPTPFQCLANDNNISKNLSPHLRNESRRECICLACGKSFRNGFSLSIHKRTHYLETKSTIKLAHKCPNCDELFNKESDMKDHLQKVHYPEGLICKICGKELISLPMLESHMRKMHLQRQFSCTTCSKNFINRDSFELHVATHIGGQVYRCPTCGRKYTNEEDLNEHINKHKERIPQCCVVCGKITLRITQHMKTHMPRPKRTLSCHICDKTFNLSSSLSQHYKIKHSMLGRPPRKRTKDDFSNDDDIACKIFVEQEVEATTVVEEKEEEAKRVIVELIKNATYTSFIPEDHLSLAEETPPIAREETITAVNSIADD